VGKPAGLVAGDASQHEHDDPVQHADRVVVVFCVKGKLTPVAVCDGATVLSGQIPYLSTGADTKVFLFFSSEKNSLAFS
jgi:hypothetical protein